MSENVEANALLKKIADTISLLPSISGLSPVTRFEDIPMAIRDLQECYKSAARSRNGADLAAENAALKQFHEAAQHGAEAFLAQIRFADSRPHSSGEIARLMEDYAQLKNAALKFTIASLLSIDDSKVSEYVVLDAEALKQAAGNRVAGLEAKVAALQWRAITPENLPKVGDEVAEYIFATVDEPDYWIVSEVDFEGGWSSVATHFRPINPPAQPVDAQKGKP